MTYLCILVGVLGLWVILELKKIIKLFKQIIMLLSDFMAPINAASASLDTIASAFAGNMSTEDQNTLLAALNSLAAKADSIASNSTTTTATPNS